MIEIKHKDTGKVLRRVDADTLRGADLKNAPLSGADLSGADLSGADMSGANLSSAKLGSTDLSYTKLTKTDLDYADLTNANLNGAKLAKADLSGAILRYADLSGAYMNDVKLRSAKLDSTNLSYADITKGDLTNTDLNNANLNSALLYGATFTNTDITSADMTNAKLGSTVFLDCLSLRLAKRLETINHQSPSSLDAITLRACVNDLPDTFLLGVGYNQQEIDYLRSMYATGPTGKVIQYYSCFLSYAHLDNEFAEKLRTDLIKNGVNCWKDDDLQTGTRWKDEIDKAIKGHDKLVLICSRRSVYRDQVVREILRALDEERTEGTQKFFPLYLDAHIFSDEVMEDAREKVRSGEWKENWIYHIRKYQAADFTNWQYPAAYQKALEKLLHDVKQPSSR